MLNSICRATVLPAALGLVLAAALLLPACAAKPAAGIHSPISPPAEGKTPVESVYRKAINLGGKWFLRNETSEFIGYEYDIGKKGYTGSKNALRQMGALWAINKLYKFTGDERYKTLGEKGFRHFRPYFNYDMAKEFYFVNIQPGDSKLGYSAFMILSILEMDVANKDSDLERLARGIIQQQRADGSLKTIFYSDEDSGVDYYPGEALLAIMSMYEYTGNEKYLAVADNALPYYRYYFSQIQVPAFVPWQTRAYTKYVQATGNRMAAGFVLTMNDYITRYFKSDNCTGFQFPGISASVYLESMVQAYSLAQKYGDDARLACYRNFIRECSDYLLTLQLPESSLPDAAIGGFLSSPSSKILRCDNNQHAVMGLMDALNAGLIK